MLPAIGAIIIYWLYAPADITGWTMLLVIIFIACLLFQLKHMTQMERELERDPMDVVLEEQLGKNHHTPTNNDDRRLK